MYNRVRVCDTITTLNNGDRLLRVKPILSTLVLFFLDKFETREKVIDRRKHLKRMKKVRRLFRLRNVVRSRNNPERMPLNPTRDRSPSIDSCSTNSSSSSGRRPNRSYGSFLPSYFTFFRNSLRRSNSSQVRIRRQRENSALIFDTTHTLCRQHWQTRREMRMRIKCVYPLNWRQYHFNYLFMFVDVTKFVCCVNSNAFLSHLDRLRSFGVP